VAIRRALLNVGFDYMKTSTKMPIKKAALHDMNFICVVIFAQSVHNVIIYAA